MAADPTYQANVYFKQAGSGLNNQLVVNATAGGSIVPNSQTQASALGTLSAPSTETLTETLATVASTSDANVADTVIVDKNFQELVSKVNALNTALTNIGILAAT